MIVYHSTHITRLDDIMKNGLQINQPCIHTTVDFVPQVIMIYGMIPLFFALSKAWLHKSSYKLIDGNVIIEVDIDDDWMVSDIPSLMDRGAYIEEGGIWFKDDSILNNNGEEIPYKSLLEDRELIEKSMKLTKTCAVMRNIEKDRIKRVSPPIKES